MTTKSLLEINENSHTSDAETEIDREYEEASDAFFQRGRSAEGYRLNEIGLELGLEGCALTDDEREIFCK